MDSEFRRRSGEADPGLISVLVGDGRSLVAFTGVCLALAGGFAIFLSLAGQFLPHDTAYLGRSPAELCASGGCRVVDFMFHDRVAFGGTLVAVGTLYLWLAVVPLGAGQPWAWWVTVVSGLAGFASFLAYLGYGYLDTWHGVATLALLPVFWTGLALTRRHLVGPAGPGALLRPGAGPPWRSLQGVGRALVLMAAAGTTASGAVILGIGATTVFVLEDLAFMGSTASDLENLSPRLIPLIAHDRAGFGGGLATTGWRRSASPGARLDPGAAGRRWRLPDWPALGPLSASTSRSATRSPATSVPRSWLPLCWPPASLCGVRGRLSHRAADKVAGPSPAVALRHRVLRHASSAR